MQEQMEECALLDQIDEVVPQLLLHIFNDYLDHVADEGLALAQLHFSHFADGDLLILNKTNDVLALQPRLQKMEPDQ